MKLSIQSIVDITLMIQEQIKHPVKSFRMEVQECAISTAVDEWTDKLEIRVNGHKVSADDVNAVSKNTIALIIEDIQNAVSESNEWNN